MLIEIKHKVTGTVIVSGEYDSIKDCLEKNTDAYLGDADLRDAKLRGADLRGADLGGADLGDADLRDAYLGDADLGDADLRGADLRGAYLGDAKNYTQSHDVFAEVVRRQNVGVFVDAEWNAIGQIIVHRLCWDTIKKRFSAVMPHIFQVCAEAGFREWREYWNKITKEG